MQLSSINSNLLRKSSKLISSLCFMFSKTYFVQHFLWSVSCSLHQSRRCQEVLKSLFLALVAMGSWIYISYALPSYVSACLCICKFTNSSISLQLSDLWQVIYLSTKVTISSLELFLYCGASFPQSKPWICGFPLRWNSTV